MVILQLTDEQAKSVHIALSSWDHYDTKARDTAPESVIDDVMNVKRRLKQLMEES